jgi:hypothetical protein
MQVWLFASNVVAPAGSCRWNMTACPIRAHRQTFSGQPGVHPQPSKETRCRSELYRISEAYLASPAERDRPDCSHDLAVSQGKKIIDAGGNPLDHHKNSSQ